MSRPGQRQDVTAQRQARDRLGRRAAGRACSCRASANRTCAWSGEACAAAPSNSRASSTAAGSSAVRSSQSAQSVRCPGVVFHHFGSGRPHPLRQRVDLGSDPRQAIGDHPGVLRLDRPAPRPKDSDPAEDGGRRRRGKPPQTERDLPGGRLPPDRGQRLAAGCLPARRRGDARQALRRENLAGRRQS